MGRPTPNWPAPEGADSPGAELTPQGQIPPGQMNDQVCPEEIEERSAVDAEAMRTGQARINNAIGAIRSFRDPQSYTALPNLPPAANLSLPQHDAANGPLNTSTPPRLDRDFAGIEARPPSLDPDIVPPPPNSTRRRIVGPTLTRFALMVGFAAIAAYGITMFSSFQLDTLWAKRSNDSAAPVGPISQEAASDTRQLSRLVVKDQQAFANEPILLEVAVAPATGYGSLLLSGLAQGTRLSAGVPLSKASWELTLRDIGGVYVYAPQDFIGVMNAMIDLLSPSKKIIDSHPMRLEWTAKADSLQPPGKINTGTASAAAIKPLEPQEAATLMERGRDLLRNGDIALAQLAFRRLADAGKADAALALATTYDPLYLAEHKFVGIVGDKTKARAWYQRASELGSTEADRILRRADKN